MFAAAIFRPNRCARPSTGFRPSEDTGKVSLTAFRITSNVSKENATRRLERWHWETHLRTLIPDTFLNITRTFAAPRDQVYAAWTEPKHLKQWWGPEGVSAPFVEIDLRSGGRYSTCMRTPDGDRWVGGAYTEVTPPEWLDFTWSWEDDHAADSPDTLVTVEFRDLGDMTEVALTHERFRSAESRDQHRHSWTSTLVYLEQALV